MKELNQQLSEQYKNILGETAITAPFGEDGLSMPFLIKFSNENKVKSADLRVMFFGQETREWTDKGTVEDIMEKYCADFNDFSNIPRHGSFWYILSEMKNKINEQLPDKHVSYIWNNIVKADYSPRADSEGYKVPDKVYAKFRDINRTLIRREIEIIKPDVLVFFTGAESSGYDKKIDDVFYYDTTLSTEKSPIAIDGNERILAIAHLPLVSNYTYDTYISYHPRALIQNQKAKDFVLNAIAEQCVAIVDKA